MRSPTAPDRPNASRFQLPPGPWSTVLDALCAAFPAVPRAVWVSRFERGRVLDGAHRPLAVDAAFRAGEQVRYFREVEDEPPLPVRETVLHHDDDLLVVDKPHFLPVTPAGRFVEQTLLVRLMHRFDNRELAPLHRIDRLTAGLMLFSTRPATRPQYQALFRERRIRKRYEAIAPPLPDAVFPLERVTRIAPGEPFFRMREVDGEANSRTRVDVLEHGAAAWRYALEPITGRKHQLRVHMAALGAPIVGDPLYPQLLEPAADDFDRPLRLLARALEFDDPLDGRPRRFESALRLAMPDAEVSAGRAD